MSKFLDTSPKDVKGKNKVRGAPAQAEVTPLNHEQERILKWLKQVRFKKKLFGGVSQADLWRKLAELNSIYDAAISAERARYDALLEAELKAEKARSEAQHAADMAAEKARYEALLAERCGPAEPGKAGDGSSG